MEEMPDQEPTPHEVPSSGDVWYVSYGSNMAFERLACYIEGGCPPGGVRTNPGARDSRLPDRCIPVELPGALYFAGRSRQWGGGVAFYDHDAPGPTAARAYLVTAGQLADIAAQEMYRLPDPEDPLEEVLVAGLTDGRHEAGPGHYETLIKVGEYDARPMLTFTSPHGLDHVEHTDPAPAYLDMLADGLREAHGWDDARIADYFARVTAPRRPLSSGPEPATVRAVSPAKRRSRQGRRPLAG